MSASDPKDHPVEALSAYVDLELGDDERRAIEAHLSECSACRECVDDLRLLDRTAADEAAPPVPGGLAGRIRAAIEASAPEAVSRPSGWWMPQIRRALPAAAAMLLVATVLWIARPGRRAPLGRASAEGGRPVSVAPAGPPPAPGPSLQGTPPPASRESSSLKRETSVQPRPRNVTEASPTPAVPREEPSPAKEEAQEAPHAEMVENVRALGYVGAAQAPDAQPHRPPPTIETPPYTVALLPESRMSVVSGAYACDVPITAEDARTLAALIEIDTRIRSEAKMARSGIAGDVAAQGTLRENRDAPAPAAGAIPASSPEIPRQAVLLLVRERYRALLEERCGPLPR